jgi:hypothetical protein
MSFFHLGLMCFVDSVSYDFATRTGTAHLGGCCDMRGCIKLFAAIDPDVEKINTFDHGKPDTSYIRAADKWRAFDNRGPAARPLGLQE